MLPPSSFRTSSRFCRSAAARYNRVPGAPTDALHQTIAEPERGFPNRALLHDSHEIQHVAVHLAGEAGADILGQMGTERVGALAVMNRTAALQ
jgi:hypothetical protein